MYMEGGEGKGRKKEEERVASVAGVGEGKDVPYIMPAV